MPPEIYITIKAIEYKPYPYNTVFIIPAGTKVNKAENLPAGKFWARKWYGMDKYALSHYDNYGFLLEREEVMLVK
tara:strand:+ start:1827 stop:2051 length:225 start_codon:yes stop_codon:yes gene_type:complete